MLDLGICTGLVGVVGRSSAAAAASSLETGGFLAVRPIKDASNLSFRLPMVSSRYDTVVVEADDGDVDAVDRIGEMLDVIGDENSLVSCFDAPERFAMSPADFFAMAMGEDRGEGDDVEEVRCRARRG